MLFRARAARNLAVCDVAQQNVLKGVLRVAGDRGPSLPPDEVLTLERAQSLLRLGRIDPDSRRRAAEPEDLAVHRGLLEQFLLGARQGVQSRGDHSLHRLRQLAGRAALREHADVLLREERIAARSFKQRALLVCELEWLLQ
jgi:hypothetical protein